MTNLITRMEYRAKLPKELIEWYDSEEPGKLAEKIATDLSIEPAKKVTLINIIGDTVLRIMNQDSLKEEVKKQLLVDETIAQRVVEKILSDIPKKELKNAPSQQTQATTISPAPVLIPSYRKPLTSVPRYQNTPAVPSTPSQTPIVPPIMPPISTPPSQPPAPPRI
jgi:hypothetical protein